MSKIKKLFLIDAFAIIYRAYFAFSKNPRINSKGVETSAVLGFVNTLVEVLKKELFNLKVEIISGQNNNTSSISKIKKDIARAKTFITMQDKEVESSNA